jgi:hypothetical protein
MIIVQLSLCHPCLVSVWIHLGVIQVVIILLLLSCLFAISLSLKSLSSSVHHCWYHVGFPSVHQRPSLHLWSLLGSCFHDRLPSFCCCHFVIIIIAHLWHSCTICTSSSVWKKSSSSSNHPLKFELLSCCCAAVYTHSEYIQVSSNTIVLQYKACLLGGVVIIVIISTKEHCNDMT